MLVVKAMEHHFGRVDGIVVVPREDFIHGEGDFGEDARGAFDVGATLVGYQTGDGSVVVGYRGCLEHLFRSREQRDGLDSVSLILLEMAEIDVELGSGNIGHGPHSSSHLEEETRHHMAAEQVGILEILWMLIVGLHHIGAVVVVGTAILVCVRTVETYADVVDEVAGSATTRIGEVKKCVSLLLSVCMVIAVLGLECE